MKVLLLSLPGQDEADGHLFPLGIGYLAAALAGYHVVEACHYNSMSEATEAIPLKLRDFRPDAVGLTCSTFNRGFVKGLIKVIRAIDDNVKIIVGGVHASFCSAQILEHYGADCVVIGEGELTLVELCNAIEKKLPLNNVCGIAYLDQGRVLTTPARSAIQSLDDLPVPDYSYARSFIEQSGMGFVITSRGCPVRCTFCSTSSFWGQSVRMHSVKRVVDDMEMLIDRFHVSKIFFHDDTFNLGVKRVKDICHEIMRRGIKVEWGCSCRVNPVSEEMLSVMVQAGCRHICWGIESGSESMLQRIDKKISLHQIRNAYLLSEKFSSVMSTGAFTMVGNPGEGSGTIKETVDFLDTLPLTDSPSTSMLYVLPGTRLYEELKCEGHVTEDDWYRFDTVPYYTLEHSLWQLSRWARLVAKSGKRIPFDRNRHFWLNTFLPEERGADVLKKIMALILSERVFAVCKKYFTRGRIRF